MSFCEVWIANETELFWLWFSQEKATEILSVICEGFGDQSKTKKAKKLADDLEPQQSQEQDDSPSPPSASAASTPNRWMNAR